MGNMGQNRGEFIDPRIRTIARRPATTAVAGPKKNARASRAFEWWCRIGDTVNSGEFDW